MATDDTDDLLALFESVTGETTVTDTQRAETGTKEVAESQDVDAVDTIDHHGFVDVIDDVEPSDDR